MKTKWNLPRQNFFLNSKGTLEDDNDSLDILPEGKLIAPGSVPNAKTTKMNPHCLINIYSYKERQFINKNHLNLLKTPIFRKIHSRSPKSPMLLIPMRCSHMLTIGKWKINLPRPFIAIDGSTGKLLPPAC